MRDVDNHYLELKGRKMEEAKREPEIKVVECVRCGSENDGADLYCGKCGLVLDREKALALGKEESDLADRLERLEKRLSWLSEPDKVKDVVEGLRLLREKEKGN